MQAEFECEREVFELRAQELGVPFPAPSPAPSAEEGAASGSALAPRWPRARHSLRFEDLVYPPQERMLREAEERALLLAKTGGANGGGAEGSEQGETGRKLGM